MQKLNLSWGITLLFFSLLFILIGIYFSAAGSTTKITEIIPNNNSTDGNFVIHVETTDDRNTLPIDYTIKENGGVDYENNGNKSNENNVSDKPAGDNSNVNTNDSNNSSSNTELENNSGNTQKNSGSNSNINNNKSNSNNSNNDNNDNNNNSNPTPSTNVTPPNNTVSNDSNNSNNMPTNEQQTPTNFTKEVTEIAITPQRIASFKNSIENKFYITIKYDYDEVKNYSTGGYSVIPMEDLNAIYSSLENLQNCLSVYPNGFFKEMRDGGFPLTVYLVKRFNIVNVTGISSKANSSANICIATDYPFESTFHHENFHYMEYYINKKGGQFTNWNNYNPSNFKYGNYEQTLVYELTNSAYSYFVNSYSQADALEDRACTFEYLMASNKISPLNQNNNIWKKGKAISSMIEYFYKTVNSNTIEYWERFL